MRGCHTQWPLTLTYIFKAIQPGLCSKIVRIWHIFSCLLYNMYSSGWIISIFGTNDHYLWEGVLCEMTFYLDLYICGHSAVTLQQLLKYGTSCHFCSTACTILDRLFPYFINWYFKQWRLFSEWGCPRSFQSILKFYNAYLIAHLSTLCGLVMPYADI